MPFEQHRLQVIRQVQQGHDLRDSGTGDALPTGDDGPCDLDAKIPFPVQMSATSDRQEP